MKRIFATMIIVILCLPMFSVPMLVRGDVQATHIVYFTEQGVAPVAGYVWSVTFNGATKQSGTTAPTFYTIEFDNVPDGLYPFTVQWVQPAGLFVPTPSSGTVQVSGQDVTKTITFNSPPPVQRSLTVSSAHDSPVPGVGVHTYNDGSSVTCSVTSPVTEGGVTYACTGWSGTGSCPSSGSGTSVVFTISQDSTITWNWVVQRSLTVSSAHDSPVPGVGVHTYNDGSSVTCSVTSPVTESGIVYTCTGWMGSGSVPSSGSGTSVTLTITQDSSITWNWYGTAVQRKLTVSSVHGSPSPAVGDHLHNDGSSVTCSVTSPVTESGIVYTCTGWMGSGSVPSSGSGTSVTLTITQDSSITWNWQASASFILVESRFSGYFLGNLSFMNTFSVYTNVSGTLPVEVYGILDGINYTFSTPTAPGGSYNLTADMGSLQPGSSLEVSAVYSGGMVLEASYPLNIIATPSWLVSLIRTATSIDVKIGNNEITGGWYDNTYIVDLKKDFDLPDKFNVNIPLPEFAGGGKFTLMPTISVEFTFSSDGSFSASASAGLETPDMDFGPASVKAHVTLSVSGDFVTQDNNIEWVSATLSFEVGASGSVNVPIAGYTFSVPGIGDVTIGLSATVSVDANFAASLVLAPTQDASKELISGLELMIQSISGQITFGLGLALNGGIGIATITGGGYVDFTVYLEAAQPYVSGGTVTGTVSVTYQALIWSGTIWSMSGKLYNWSSDPNLSIDPTNFTVMPRYYNTTNYEGFVWTSGSRNGTAVQDVYPFTRISASSNGDNAYILYTSDNVSMPEQYGLCLTGLEFNSSQGTLDHLPMPSIANEIFLDPVVISLPNGTLLGMWDSVPLSEMSNATNPFEINEIIPQFSYFDPNTRTWGPVRNLTQSGVANSYSLSSDSTGCYALVLGGDSIFSSSQHLVEYDVHSDFQLLSMSVANVSSIVSFNNLAHVAVLQLIDGSYELMNLSSLQLITIPSMSGCTIKSVQLAMNSTDSLGILYSNSTSSIFSIYNIPSNTAAFSVDVSRSTSCLTLIQEESGYHLVTADSSGITSYLIENQSETDRFYPLENITSMGATDTNNGILVYTTENYGNSSYPLLNLTLTYVNALTGDITGPNGYPDGIVDMRDIGYVASRFLAEPGKPLWDPNADINGDGIVDMQDIGTAAAHFLEHYP